MSIEATFPMGAEKKVRQLLEKLRRVPDLSDAERAVFAVSLASTPDERWDRMQRFLRSHGFSNPSTARRSRS